MFLRGHVPHLLMCKSKFRNSVSTNLLMYIVKAVEWHELHENVPWCGSEKREILEVVI